MSEKFSRPDQEEKSNINNKYNTKRTYTAALRSNRPYEQQKPDRIKNQQHDEVLNSHNHHTKNTTSTSSTIKIINRQEE